MKIKKLMSIGAIALTLICSTSVGASAAERPTNETIKTDIAKLFNNNSSLLTNYDLRKNTKVSGVVSKSTLQTNATTYAQGYQSLDKALSLIDTNKTIQNNAILILKEIKTEDLLTDIRNLAQDLRNIENMNGEEKFKLEKDIENSIIEKNPQLNVIFGKNVDGRITMSIIKGQQIILQLNSGNAYTISAALLSGDILEKYAELLKLL